LPSKRSLDKHVRRNASTAPPNADDASLLIQGRRPPKQHREQAIVSAYSGTISTISHLMNRSPGLLHDIYERNASNVTQPHWKYAGARMQSRQATHTAAVNVLTAARTFDRTPISE